MTKIKNIITSRLHCIMETVNFTALEQRCLIKQDLKLNDYA